MDEWKINLHGNDECIEEMENDTLKSEVKKGLHLAATRRLSEASFS